MIPRELFDRYATAVDVNADMARRAVMQLEKALAGLSGKAMRAELSRQYAAIVREFGGYVAACAVELYAEVRAGTSLGTRYDPVQCEPDDSALLSADVNQAVKRSPDLQAALASLSGSAVQRSMAYADETLIQNAKRDPAKPRYALVPHAGACGFCVMLASQGFVYASDASANRSRHPSCRCRPVVDFKDYGVVGVSQEAYTAEYEAARDAVKPTAWEEWSAMTAAEKARYGSKKRGAYDHYLRNRIASEMDKRRR